MTIKLYKYNRYPNNPNIRPNFFQEKYYIGNYEDNLPDTLKNGIIEFIINMNLMVGDSFEYNSSIKENLNSDVDKMCSGLIQNNLLNYLRSIPEKLIPKTTTDNNILYTSYFTETIINYENIEYVNKNQFSISNSRIREPYISTISYKFKINN